MLTFKDAIAAAHSFAAEIFSAAELRGLRVEALTKSDDGQHWYITLGWPASDTRIVNPPSALSMQNRADLVEVPRVYKKFKIDATTGDLVSMSDGG
jgi:hypothetical protein